MPFFRAVLRMEFAKYHGLGNDYVVIDPVENEDLPNLVRGICDVHRGLGADGVLIGPLPSEQSLAKVRIFNPDGSEAEKSGNGLRIFCRHLWEKEKVRDQPFFLETIGGVVRCVIHDPRQNIEIEMGTVSFRSADIPVTRSSREVVQEKIKLAEESYEFTAATIGNPHCVLILPEISEQLARRIGPLIENHSLFPNRTNVQFCKIIDRQTIQIEIWERGAGYTLASGTSSCAAATVARHLNFCDQEITVIMPGGRLRVEVDATLAVTLSGSVTKIADGRLAEEMFTGNLTSAAL